MSEFENTPSEVAAVADKPCDKPCDEPCDKPCDKPCDEPCDKPCDKPCDEPCDKPCDEPCDKPCDEPRDKHTWYSLDRNIGRYMGEWRNNQPHGKGCKEYYNDDSELGRSTVHGKFVDGRIEGFGIQVFEQTHEPSIPYYIGTFKNSEHDGFGEYHFGTGSFYKGEFKMGKFHGRGMFYSKANDNTFVGEYANDAEVSGVRFKGRVA